jgi:hypothetical protein
MDKNAEEGVEQHEAEEEGLPLPDGIVGIGRTQPDDEEKDDEEEDAEEDGVDVVA